MSPDVRDGQNKKLIHESFMKRCIEIANESMGDGDLPFGALIVHDSKIIAEAKNTAITKNDVTGHAEMNVIRMLQATHSDIDFQKCIIYTNFEPCAMCSFAIRDLGIGEIVFSCHSPHLGGHTRWDILKDDLRPEFTTNAQTKNPPLVTGGILKKEVSDIFEKLNWKMHKTD